MLKIAIFLVLLVFEAHAAETVDIFGSANTPSGKQTEAHFSFEEQNEIENTLYEGGNRIYDVQSFPINDIKTITEPNIDPTISTYPEY